MTVTCYCGIFWSNILIWVLLLLIHCSLFEFFFVFGPSYAIEYLMSLLVLHELLIHLDEEDRAGCFTFVSLLPCCR